jgi:hypothetical protein
MESYPTFHNEVGVPIVRIGCREFKCTRYPDRNRIIVLLSTNAGLRAGA